MGLLCAGSGKFMTWILLYWEGSVTVVSSLVFQVTNPEPESDIFLAFSEEHWWKFRLWMSWSALMMGRKGNKYLHLFLWTCSLFYVAWGWIFFQIPLFFIILKIFYWRIAQRTVSNCFSPYAAAFWVLLSHLKLDYCFLGAFSSPVPFCLCSPGLASYILHRRGQDSWE